MLPALSVLLPVRDQARYLPDCLASIRDQRFGNFEVVTVNDGSTDATGQLLASAAAGDARVRVLAGGGNGIVSALNMGLGACRAPLVARMDGDDRMHPERLARLVAGFARWPDTALLASRAQLFPAGLVGEGMRRYMRWQDGLMAPEAIAADMFWEAPFVHPCVAFRRDIVMTAGSYRDGAFPEDYELWLRLHADGHVMRKLGSRLLQWRQHGASLTRTDQRYSRAAFDSVRFSYLGRFLARRGRCRVVVWGAGRRTRQRARRLLDAGIRVEAWVDIDPRKIGKYYDGAPVKPPSWLRQARPETVLACVTKHGALERIGSALDFMGFERGRDWWPVG
ncbi:MAG: glycosyltransferase [Pseudomonadota bacterium]